MQAKKVSVIVPIYKVEKYIQRCIDSILNQTYLNTEIILVDDGSPDNCGKIADYYQEKNPNQIKVIHKENGGLSDARNRGMELVTGEYTMFVDSDDWIESRMIEVMMNSVLKYGADAVQSAFYYAYEDKLLVDNRYWNKSIPLEVIDTKTLMHELVVNEKVKNFAWGKLYKTEIIRDIPFEIGVLFEDVFWAHRVMHKVKRFVCIHKPMYYYLQRDDSIVANYSLKNLEMITGLRERHLFVEKCYPELVFESYKVIFKSCLTHYNLLLLNKRMDKRGVNRKEIQKYIRDHYSEIKEAVKSDKRLKKHLYLFSLHPYLNVLFVGFRKGLRKLKIVSEPHGLERVDKI